MRSLYITETLVRDGREGTDVNKNVEAYENATRGPLPNFRKPVWRFQLTEAVLWSKNVPLPVLNSERAIDLGKIKLTPR